MPTAAASTSPSAASPCPGSESALHFAQAIAATRQTLAAYPAWADVKL